MRKSFFSKKILTQLLAVPLVAYTCPFYAKAADYDAICSYYSDYHPCDVKLSSNTIKANLPTDFLLVDKSNFLDLVVYEDLHKSSNLVIGTVTTLLLGPIGLLGFLATKTSGTIDYAIKFNGDDGRRRTALIRFKNLKVAGKFGEEISTILPRLIE
ncbi:hypothetical protein Q3Y53_09225 [Synechococcus sp. YX-04-1]|uniref:hypothetical protein n=1 Tax=Synechococcus sp. YX-04-1 TaxID=3062778 RepID=UPI0026E257D7|nr:hypothetical protein [Synechococcus sp. YX-04-1]MDO6352725.1 hypothetical protein [Synechococcus sp. YX-04-1]